MRGVWEGGVFGRRMRALREGWGLQRRGWGLWRTLLCRRVGIRGSFGDEGEEVG